jgi:catechol 2,3-dioxygenase-like lactoylglutathione lyase family enzyme
MEHMTSIRGVNLGVTDLSRAVRFYEQAFGFVERGASAIEDERLKELWRMDTDLKGEYVLMSPPELSLSDEGIWLRLARFNRGGTRIWQDYQYPRDRGLFAMTFRMREPARGWQRLMAAGAFDHEPKAGGTRASGTPLCCDPNGVMLGLSGTHHHAQQAPDGVLGVVEIHVGDMERAQNFYTCLGFEPQQPEEEETVSSSMTGISDLSRVHLHHREDPGARGCLELVCYPGRAGRSMRGRAVPPNAGMLSLSFACHDLDHTLAALEQITGKDRWRRGPFTLNLPPLGQVRMSALLGPDDEMIELYQPIKT